MIETIMYHACSISEPLSEGADADLRVKKAQKELKEIQDKNTSLEKECIIFKSQLKVNIIHIHIYKQKCGKHVYKRTYIDYCGYYLLMQ